MDIEKIQSDLKKGKTLSQTDDYTGFKTTYRYDPNSGKVVIKTNDYKSHSVLEENQKLYEENESGWKGDVHRVARIPKLALYNYCEQRGMTQSDLMDDRKEFNKFLNDSDNRQFRVKRGRI